MNIITYRRGYKYQLHDEYTDSIPIYPAVSASCRGGYITLSTQGKITIKKGYAWDGPSGPTIDTLNFMRGSLVHDALYQLMREGAIGRVGRRDQADRLLQQMCREDGMSAVRAWWVYWGVRKFGGAAADPRNTKKIITSFTPTARV